MTERSARPEVRDPPPGSARGIGGTLGVVRFARPRRTDTLVAVVACLALVLAIVVVVAVRVATAPADRVPAGTSIGGVAVGGLSADEAERAVLAGAAPPKGSVELDSTQGAGVPTRVPFALLGPTPQARAAVQQALGRRSLVDQILGEVGLARNRAVALRFGATPERARAVVERIAAAVEIPSVPASLRVVGGRVVATPGREGQGVDVARLIALLVPLPARAVVPFGAIAPEVTDAQAEAARALAEGLVAAPMVVAAADRRAAIPRERLLAALRFAPAPGGIGVSLAPGPLADAVRPAFAGILRPARSAGFRVEGTRAIVVPAQDGRRLDAAALAHRAERRSGAAPVALPVVVEAPARTTRQARRMGIRERVSTFTTPYACCQPRVANIARAAEILDGLIVPAGARFSLNEALGERTTARGFVPAPQINAGKLEDAVGGGVSQMSTTIYNAAFLAGLEIVTHTPHEFWITRYPPGREATVSWGGPEMIVRNDWPAAILLRVTARKTALTVSIFSSALDRRVTTTTSGDAVAGAAFTETYTRRVVRGDTVRRDETYRWTYTVPPPDE